MKHVANNDIVIRRQIRSIGIVAVAISRFPSTVADRDTDKAYVALYQLMS